MVLWFIPWQWGWGADAIRELWEMGGKSSIVWMDAQALLSVTAPGYCRIQTSGESLCSVFVTFLKL